MLFLFRRENACLRGGQPSVGGNAGAKFASRENAEALRETDMRVVRNTDVDCPLPSF